MAIFPYNPIITLLITEHHHGHHHGHSGNVHRTDFHPGTVHHGGYGGGYGGGGGSHHGYGKNIVPGESDDVSATKLQIEKLVPKDDLSNGKQTLDFVSEASLSSEQNTPGVLLEVDDSKTTQAAAQFAPASFNLNNASGEVFGLNANLVRRKEKTENALTRTFLKPVSFQGSILNKYKKHWDDEEDGKTMLYVNQLA